VAKQMPGQVLEWEADFKKQFYFIMS